MSSKDTVKEGVVARARALKRDDLLERDDKGGFFRFMGRRGRLYVLIHYREDGGLTQFALREREFDAKRYRWTGEQYDRATHNPPPKPKWTTKTEGVKHGWLAPDGRMYPCSYSGHKVLADHLAFHRHGVERARNPERFVEERGYVKLQRDDYSTGTYSWHKGFELAKKLTKAQERYIARHSTDHDYMVPYFMED